jgi:aryl-alcohol dehydrogenase-like predicted oxidoreductase
MHVMRAAGPDRRPSRDAGQALVRRAAELGVALIDTADIYGDGASEEIVAEALAPYGDEAPLIATKGGFVPGDRQPGRRALPADGRPERLKEVCDASLRRLRLERIELYQLHTPDERVPYADSIGALVELRDAGKIAHIGISNVGRRHLATALELTPVASVQNRFNHADRTSQRVLDECASQGIWFLPWGPIRATDDPVLVEVAAEVGASVQQVGIAWLLQHSAVMVPIPGTSSVGHLEQNVAALGVELTSDQVARLDAVAPAQGGS